MLCDDEHAYKMPSVPSCNFRLRLSLSLSLMMPPCNSYLQSARLLYHDDVPFRVYSYIPWRLELPWEDQG